MLTTTMSSSRPVTPGGTNIRDRLQTLSVRCDTQEQELAAAKAEIDRLRSDNGKLEEALANQVDAINARITRELVDLKHDTEHKFALQVAENKRLQHHISLQKTEATKLQQQIAALQERLVAVENELG